MLYGTVNIKEFAGIEQYGDDEGYVQMGFKNGLDENGDYFREYIVLGSLKGEQFFEHFFFDDPKKMAYEYYDEKVNIIDNGCIYCIECGEYAQNPEFAIAVSQTGGYCLDCAPDPDDQEAIRWY